MSVSVSERFSKRPGKGKNNAAKQKEYRLERAKVAASRVRESIVERLRKASHAFLAELD